MRGSHTATCPLEKPISTDVLVGCQHVTHPPCTAGSSVGTSTAAGTPAHPLLRPGVTDHAASASCASVVAAKVAGPERLIQAKILQGAVEGGPVARWG